jgi:D-glycero-alpha-D-manno-heptose-7-phosphate kinase
VRTKSNPGARPVRIVRARAPIRINDIGGWTDTWFAAGGAVLNFAVKPAVEARVVVSENVRRVKRRVTVRAANYKETFLMDPSRPRREPHPLLQFAISSLPVPERWALEITLASHVPAGISTGTSASVCVALLGALNALRRHPLGWREIARLAHRVETDLLGQQSGIQDQIAAAHGGITFIRMTRYPDAEVHGVRVPKAVRAELGRRLCLVYLGRPHRSSAMHEHVIAELEAGGPQREHLRALGRIARQARRELKAGDLTAFGEAMIRNNERQRALFSGLVGRDADAVAAVARKFGAAGWKVNGAGGKGGSMTVLAAGDDGRRKGMVEAIHALGRGVRILPISLSEMGLEVWDEG